MKARRDIREHGLAALKLLNHGEAALIRHERHGAFPEVLMSEAIAHPQA
jgi:hypothetical protein